MNDQQYYYIMRIGHSVSKVRHSTFESAKTEALRLAEQHPESQFEILKCIAEVRRTQVEVVMLEGKTK